MAGTVALGGTQTAPTNKPTSEGHTIVSRTGQVELNHQNGLLNDDDWHQELNLFIGEMSRVLAMAPRACMVRLQHMLNVMLSTGPLN